jgi:hypothetical protein
MPETPRMSWPYPVRSQRSWYDIISRLYDLIDTSVYTTTEDRNWMIMGGGTWIFDDTTGILSWSDTIEFMNFVTGYKISVSAGSVTLSDGQIAYIDMPRSLTMNMSATMQVGNTVGRSDNKIVMAVRRAERVYLRGQFVLVPGVSAEVYESGPAAFTDFYGAPVQDLPALRAVGPAARFDKQMRLVEDKNAVYRFNTAGLGSDDNDTIIVPNDIIPPAPGRWFKIVGVGISNHELLSGLLGGAAGDHYHITGVQHTGLVTNVSADGLHLHTPSVIGADTPADRDAAIASHSALPDIHHSRLHALSSAEDHSGTITSTQHGSLPGGSLHAVATPISNGFMSFTDKSKLDGLVYSDVNPNDVGTPSPGISTNISRSDHVHGHGNLAGGSFHALAVAGVSHGFLSASDKSKLDALIYSNTNPNYLGTPSPGTSTDISRADHIHGHGDLSADTSTFHCPTSVGLGNVTNNAQLKRSADDWGGFSDKAPPSNGDRILIEDSSASWVKKKITIENLPFLKRTSNDWNGYSEKTAVDLSDRFLIEDAADSYNKKKTQATYMPFLKRGAGDFDGFTPKSPLSDEDIFLIEDCEAGNVKKKTTLGEIIRRWWTYSEAGFNTNSTSWVNATSLSFTVYSDGNFKIEWYFEANSSSSGTEGMFRITDGTNTFAEFAMSDPGGEISLYAPMSGFRIVDLTSGSKTIYLDFMRNGSSGTIYIRRVELTVTRVYV